MSMRRFSTSNFRKSAKTVSVLLAHAAVVSRLVFIFGSHKRVGDYFLQAGLPGKGCAEAFHQLIHPVGRSFSRANL